MTSWRPKVEVKTSMGDFTVRKCITVTLTLLPLLAECVSQYGS